MNILARQGKIYPVRMIKFSAERNKHKGIVLRILLFDTGLEKSFHLGIIFVTETERNHAYWLFTAFLRTAAILHRVSCFHFPLTRLCSHYFQSSSGRGTGSFNYFTITRLRSLNFKPTSIQDGIFACRYRIKLILFRNMI